MKVQVLQWYGEQEFGTILDVAVGEDVIYLLHSPLQSSSSSLSASDRQPKVDVSVIRVLLPSAALLHALRLLDKIFAEPAPDAGRDSSIGDTAPTTSSAAEAELDELLRLCLSVVREYMDDHASEVVKELKNRYEAFQESVRLLRVPGTTVHGAQEAEISNGSSGQKLQTLSLFRSFAASIISLETGKTGDTFSVVADTSALHAAARSDSFAGNDSQRNLRFDHQKEVYLAASLVNDGGKREYEERPIVTVAPSSDGENNDGIPKMRASAVIDSLPPQEQATFLPVSSSVESGMSSGASVVSGDMEVPGASFDKAATSAVNGASGSPSNTRDQHVKSGSNQAVTTPTTITDSRSFSNPSSSPFSSSLLVPDKMAAVSAAFAVAAPSQAAGMAVVTERVKSSTITSSSSSKHPAYTKSSSSVSSSSYSSSSMSAAGSQRGANVVLYVWVAF